MPFAASALICCGICVKISLIASAVPAIDVPPFDSGRLAVPECVSCAALEGFPRPPSAPLPPALLCEGGTVVKRLNHASAACWTPCRGQIGGQVQRAAD